MILEYAKAVKNGEQTCKIQGEGALKKFYIRRLCPRFNDLPLYMLWFNFFLGLNFIGLVLKLIIIHYHTPKQRTIKFKPRKKLNHNIYTILVTEKVHVPFSYTKYPCPCISFITIIIIRVCAHSRQRIPPWIDPTGVCTWLILTIGSNLDDPVFGSNLLGSTLLVWAQLFEG